MVGSMEVGGGVWVCRDGVGVWRWGVVCGCVGMVWRWGVVYGCVGMVLRCVGMVWECGGGGGIWVCRDGVGLWGWEMVCECVGMV